MSRYLVQALVEHTGDGILDEVNPDVSHRASHLAGQRVALEHHQGFHAGELLVCAYEDERLLVVGHGIFLADSSIGSRSGDVGKHLLQLLLDGFGVNIAHDDECLQVRTVPLAVVAAKGLVGEVLHYFHCADGHTLSVLAVLADDGQSLLDETHLSAAAHAPFFFDDAALLVDFLVLEQQVVAPVVQDKQTGVDGTSRLDVHIIYIINSLVEGSISIEVLAELHADALQVLLQGIAREVGRAVEAHVFEEVSQSALVVLLLHGADALGDVEVATLLWPLVVTDVIGKAVLQLAGLDSRVKGYGRHLHLLSRSH